MSKPTVSAASGKRATHQDTLSAAFRKIAVMASAVGELDDADTDGTSTADGKTVVAAASALQKHVAVLTFSFFRDVGGVAGFMAGSTIDPAGTVCFSRVDGVAAGAVGSVVGSLSSGELLLIEPLSPLPIFVRVSRALEP